MKRATVFSALMVAGLASGSAWATVSGAIWTSLSDGSEVDFNIYASKDDVYLNGGPGKGAGTNAPGLAEDGVPNGTYIFMVTDPSGKTLLSTDAAICRQVTVTNGIFAGVVQTGCAHAIGTEAVGVPVQLMPYNDTPNSGGEYKAWLTPADKYACADLTVPCGDGTFGFIDSDSKTDNFKVNNNVVVEMDTRFYDASGQVIDGLGITWTDTLGASNRKFSYYAPDIVVMHEAHVEAPEIGTHFISIANQPGCTVGTVYAGGALQKKQGPQTIAVHITQAMKNKSPFTYRIDVNCL